jgi:hypothetical protein
MDRTWFSEGKENFHVNKQTIKFIMRNFFNIYAKPGAS